MDLIIRDARLRHRDGLADIGIAGGRIEATPRASPAAPPRRSTPPAA
jgi:hypothetical protein